MAERSEPAFKMLAAAIEKEQQAIDFYKEAARKCSDPLGKDIFEMLTTQEGVHIARIKELYTDLESKGAWTSSWKDHKQENDNLQQLFRTRMAETEPKAKGSTGDIEALTVGMEMEQGAIDFYFKELDRAEDPTEREFIQRMIREERSHYGALADIRLYLSNPESWHVEMERHVLDGA